MKRVTTMFLAAGLIVLAAVLPTNWAAAQQAVVTDSNVSEMVKNAKTSAEHEAIAAYYDREGAENEKKAELHRAMENMYTKPVNQLHCSPLVKAYQQAAVQDKALAAYHREMAKKAGS